MLRALFADCRHRTTEGFRTMKSRTTMTYAVALALASTLTLTGCNGGDDEPTKRPTGTSSATGSSSPSGSTSPTSSASPTPSVNVSIPAAARANTEAGSIEFGKFFIEELDKAYVTTDSSSIEAMSDPGCGGCKAVAGAIRGMHEDGIHQERPAVTIAGGQYVPIHDAPAVDVFAEYESVPRVDSKGAVVTPGRAEKVAYRLTVEWAGQGWKVVETDVLN